MALPSGLSNNQWTMIIKGTWKHNTLKKTTLRAYKQVHLQQNSEEKIHAGGNKDKFLAIAYGRLNENIPHRLMYLNTWSVAGSDVWELWPC